MKKLLEGLATVALRRPGLVVALVGAVALASVAATVLGPLEVSTSRRSLISDEEPGQARLLAFLDRFGRPDATIFVVTGGAQAERRRVAALLVERLSARPDLEHRVLGRLDMRLLAEVLALNHPRLLDGFSALAHVRGAHTGLADVIGALEKRILAALDGQGDSAGDERDLARIVPLVKAFDHELRGDESKESWIGLAEGNGLSSHTNLDELGYLVAADGERYLVIAFPDLPSDEGKDVTPFIEELRALRDQVHVDAAVSPEVRAELTGLPALASDELVIVESGIRLSSVLSMLGIFALLLFAFRSLRQSIIALVPLGAGVLITLGFVEVLFDGLNLITSSFLSLLMGLGIDFGVHLLYRYQEERRAGRDDATAMRASLLGAGPGVATGAATTALAFMMTATTEFTAFSELGVITAIGLFVMLGSAFWLLPPLLRAASKKRSRPPPPDFPGGGAALALVRRAPRAVLIAGALATTAAIVAFIVDRPAFNGRYFDFLPEHTESYRGLKALEDDEVMGPALVNLSVSSLDEARALADRLRHTPEVGTVHSPTDLLPPLDAERLASLRAGVARLTSVDPARLVPPPTPTEPARIRAAVVALQDAFDELAFALEQGGRDPATAREAATALKDLAHTLADLPPERHALLAGIERDIAEIARRVLVTARAVAERGAYAPSDLPPLFRVRYVARDGAALALFAYPSGDIWDTAFARRFEQVIHGIQPEASGLALDIPRHETMITSGFERAALYAALLVALMLLLVFRSVADAALAMMPVVIGWIWMLGLMPAFGLEFDIANVVALPLVLGIGVDTGCHLVHRARESRAGGEIAHLGELVRGTGSAVLVSALTTMVGFLALLTGGYGAMVSLGLLVVLGIGMCLLASLLVLPALLVVLGRAD